MSELPTAPPPANYGQGWEHEAPTRRALESGKYPIILEEVVKPSTRDPRRE